jgi:hypothetical protein
MMAEAVEALLAIRLKSIAFLKSGWLPAIKRLEPYAEKIGGQGATAGPDGGRGGAGEGRGEAGAGERLGIPGDYREFGGGEPG